MTLSVGHRPRDPDILVMEAWGQGFLVGSLVVMIAITAANMKKGMLLHKLIVAELALALGHGTFTFLHAPAQGWDPWWIFTTCFLLYIIQRGYGCSLMQLIRISPRFGVMLLFMVISVVFAVVDMYAIRVENRLGYPPGMEPFWKMSGRH
ncbi:hypothetical protein CBS11350_5121 [Aspergillus niger]|nr:hypothetical protein CBS11350_5121 [Aspergillus niger]